MVSMRGLLILLAFVTTTAGSHELWFEKEANTYILYQGHRHSSHRGAAWVPYAPGSVKGFVCIDDDGVAQRFGPAQAYPAKISGDCATLYTTFSTGFWTQTAWETKNQAKTGLSGVIKSWYSAESLKRIERWTTHSLKPIGLGLEITPMSNPFLLKAGDKLIVLITEGAQPVAGIPVAYAGEVRGFSGADGKVAIRLRQGGLQLLAASFESPLTDGQADVAIHTASIQFEIEK